MNKYHNKKTMIDNINFASKREAGEYLKIKAGMKSGAIKDFKCQPRFKMPCGITYVADFLVIWKDGREEIFDVKGFKTTVYQLKKKMMENCLKKKIVEI